MPRRSARPPAYVLGVSIAVALIVVAAACKKSTKGPPLDGFLCGTIAGYICPPESTCPDCSEADCGGQCSATKPCNPAATEACGPGLACDPASKFCMPAKTCEAKNDCEPAPSA